MSNELEKTNNTALEIVQEKVKDLNDKKKELEVQILKVETEINNATNDLAFVRSEVFKVTKELAELKIKHQEKLKFNGDELSKVQIEVQKAKDDFDNLLKVTAKEKGEMETKHTELDAKLLKFAEDKKTNQALIDEKKGILATIKKESAELEITRARAEGQVNEMNNLNKKFQALDQQAKQREDGMKSQENEVTNRSNAVNEKAALLASLEVALANREKKVKEDEALVDAKMSIIKDKETYIVKLIEEAKLKGVDVEKFAPKEEPKAVEPKEEVVAGKKAKKGKNK